MKKTSTKGRIWDAYVACERLCGSNRDADAWFRKAFEEASRGEKAHRATGKRYTNGSAAYKLTVADAARFFAVKWFLDRMSAPDSYAEACGLRPDVLFALGARDRVLADSGKVETWAKIHEEFRDVTSLDYSEVFAA
jgi:hypothetical protein